jgi:hypothetical protein
VRTIVLLDHLGPSRRHNFPFDNLPYAVARFHPAERIAARFLAHLEDHL